MPETTFHHEQLDVYRIAIKFVAWVSSTVAELSGPARHARDQLLRSSQSIPQNLAEGIGKRIGPDRSRYFEIASGSVTESAATLDVLVAIGAIENAKANEGKSMLIQLSQMLTKLASPESSAGPMGGEMTKRRRHRKHLFRAGRRYGGKRTPGSKIDH